MKKEIEAKHPFIWREWTILFLIMVFTSSLSAQTYFVKPNGKGNGLSWKNASNLQKVLSKADFGSEVWVAAGTYHPTNNNDRTASFIIPDGVKLYGGFKGDEKDIKQRNPISYLTILSGEIGSSKVEDNSFTIIYTKDIGSQTLLDGFHIIGGYAADKEKPIGHPHRSGAAWYNESLKNKVNPSIQNCYFTNNTSMDGGAVYHNITTEDAQVSFIRCSFINNIAFMDGGAIFNNCQSHAAFISYFNGCVFTGNESGNGAVIFNFDINGKSDLAFDYTAFNNNTAFGRGKTIYNLAPSQENIIFRYCSFDENQAFIQGGQVFTAQNVKAMTTSLNQNAIKP